MLQLQCVGWSFKKLQDVSLRTQNFAQLEAKELQMVTLKWCGFSLRPWREGYFGLQWSSCSFTIDMTSNVTWSCHYCLSPSAEYVSVFNDLDIEMKIGLFVRNPNMLVHKSMIKLYSQHLIKFDASFSAWKKKMSMNVFVQNNKKLKEE